MSDLSPVAQALGRMPTGLYLVTTRDGEAPLGFVGSFVMQAGFEPPTIMVAIGSDRDHLAAIRASGRFAVSILDEASKGLMSAFFGKDGSPFDAVQHADSPGGMPVFPEALAWLDCKLSGEHALGDHVAVFGTVEAAERLRDADPSIHLRKNGLSY
jgi:flavin reductase (DIM6/NTAB) family NADH-FMN oxidoreductase RutF